MTFCPSYVSLSKTGELAARANAALDSLRSCAFCPRRCAVDRSAGKVGFCGAGDEARVARVTPHFGEEPPISGTGGSGTIFFTGCQMRCIFCQNYQISQEGLGEGLDIQSLAAKMLDLQNAGCHNVNLVSATPHVPQVLQALDLACKQGLRLPLVWNSSGYECLDTLRLLDGVVDIYLPDAKYADDSIAHELSGVRDYCVVNLDALQEMYRQVGSLECDEDRIARRGLIIRHLVLPGNLSGTRLVLERIANHIGTNVHLSLMGQYIPTHKASGHPLLARRLSPSEYDAASSLLDEFGFEQGWCQEPDEVDGEFLPDFSHRVGF